MMALAHRRDNNFNLIRMIAATAVLISHAYPIALGAGAPEPLSALLGFNLGTLAVYTFFVISGFFIAQSYDRSRSLVDFWIARGLRIYPGLLVALLLTVAALGPAFTRLPLGAYFAEPRTMTYIFSNLSLKWLQYDLPGVFAGNPYPEAINGSLWSLFYEVMCYGLVACIGVLGISASQRLGAVFFAAYAVIYILFGMSRWTNQVLLLNTYHVSLPFVIGMAFYQFRAAIPLHGLLVPLMLVAVGGARHLHMFHEVFILTWCYAVFYLASVQYAPLLRYNAFGDYSYGMYIYAFPCEQMVASLRPGISPAGVMALSFPATLGLAVLSWMLIERRALACRRSAGQRLRRLLRCRGSLSE